MSARTQYVIAAAIFAAALICAAFLGPRVLLIMSVVMPMITTRHVSDIWIGEQQRQKKPVNAAAIRRWVMIGMCVYGLLAVLATGMVQRLSA